MGVKDYTHEHDHIPITNYNTGRTIGGQFVIGMWSCSRAWAWLYGKALKNKNLSSVSGLA